MVVVDDLPSARHFVRAALEADTEITVVGEASNGAEGAAMVERLKPDVVTMDVMMPVMDGCTATERIMASRPTPIVAVTSLPLADGRVLARMLGAGALDVVGKAFGRDPARSAQFRAELVAKVKAAARARVPAPISPRTLAPETRPAEKPSLPARRVPPIRVVVVAASTGGPGALQELLKGLGPDFPCPVLVV
ncbi:MAG: response regulator, partial [Armatimonadota bacterium]|nr:response regulator [Armatimonadota bacterium]